MLTGPQLTTAGTLYPGLSLKGLFVVRYDDAREEAFGITDGAEMGQEILVNAYKRGNGYYSDDDVAFLTAIDPLFPVNNRRHPSLGRACRTGDSVFSVDGDGVMRRCHFVKLPIGNIYQEGWEAALRPRPCPNETCGCHIGYVHMPERDLYAMFGDGLLERRLPLPTIPRKG